MAAADQDAVSGMEQVRDLLFGAQVKQIEDRIKRQDEALNERINKFSSEVGASFARLETLFQDRLKEETSQRSEGRNLVENKIERLKEEIASSLNALSGSLSKTESQLNELINANSDRFNGALRDQRDETLKAIGDLAAALRKELVSKASLAEIFVKLAGDATGADANESGGNG